EIPTMNWEGGALLTPSPAAPASGAEKFRAQSPTTTTSNFSLPTFFSAAGEPSISICPNRRKPRRFSAGALSSSSPRDAGAGRGSSREAPPLPDPLLHCMEERECSVAAPPRCVVFMRIGCRRLVRLIAIFSRGNRRRRRQTAARFDGIEVAAHVLGQLIQNHLSFFGLILPPCRLPMKNGRAVGDQSGQLIFQSQQISGCLAQAQSFTRDARLQTFPFLAQLRKCGIAGQSHRAV